jgi:hypothetical protein
MTWNRNPQERYRFRPCLEPLEDRMAPASAVSGAASQVGSMLSVGVISSSTPVTLIVEDGQGDVAVAWNGFNFNIFSGIKSIQVNSQGVGNIVFLYALAPLQTPQELSLNLSGSSNLLLYHLPVGGASLTALANVPVPFLAF